MEWTAITVTTSIDASEAVSNMFAELAVGGVQIDDQTTNPELDDQTVQVTAYIPSNTDAAPLLASVRGGLTHLSDFGLEGGAGTVATTTIDDGQWTNVWEQYYHAVRLTRYLTVAPRWEEYSPSQPGELVVRLDPGQAFGTGTHPTTRLVLQLLEAVVRGGERTLDVGTGSGVLAVAAEQLGVGSVLATDIDAVAVASAEKNIALNPVSHITVVASDLLRSVPDDQQFDLVLANILPDVLERLVPEVPHVLAERGQLILSGILLAKEPRVRQWLTDAGLVVTTAITDGKWVALLATRPDGEVA